MYEEFSCKTLMTKGFLTPKEIELYLPSGKYTKVDRQFVWDIFKYLRSDKADKYYEDVLAEKMGSRVPKK